MSSLRRIASSRANGAKSHGPKTEAGIRVSSRNAITHGLTAATVVLAAESCEEFDASLRTYIEHFQPRTQTALDLVHQLAAVAWRIARFAGIEARVFDEYVDTQRQSKENRDKTGPELIALAFQDLATAGPTLSLLNRYQARLNREYQRTLSALDQLPNGPPVEEQKTQNEPSSTDGHHPVAQPDFPISTHDVSPALRFPYGEREARADRSALPLLRSDSANRCATEGGDQSPGTQEARAHRGYG